MRNPDDSNPPGSRGSTLQTFVIPKDLRSAAIGWAINRALGGSRV